MFDPGAPQVLEDHCYHRAKTGSLPEQVPTTDHESLLAKHDHEHGTASKSWRKQHHGDHCFEKMEMARPRLQNGTRLATQGGTEMDSTGEKKTWTTERDESSRTEASLCRQHPQQQLTDQSGAPLPSPQEPDGAERIE
ncbi:hypothetical protein DPMN_089891 [Dreissena polymorpha]|uniref:Uncharacterized protein n=1 Tax=Dreissena polymorpha TaxID=45954 RepID=A0A9D4KX63_DREPO|nr:hypothetical protein DPMN_089891 [Dreissena polymorpha]